MGVMPPPPSPLESSRLENLSLDSQGAAFDLAGRPIRLAGEGYASPVASIREFYQHALSDYYQRSAELSRQAAAHRPPLLRRMLSWVGRLVDRLASGPRADEVPGGLYPPSPPAAPTAPVPIVPLGKGASPEPGRHGSPVTIPSGTGGLPQADGKVRSPAPPLLQVVFADQNGVHVIWHLPSPKHPSNAKQQRPADPKTAAPRLELTYGLDSAMAQRLQDCYGQLAQLGYKIAGLDAVHATPEKSAGGKIAAKSELAAALHESKPAAAEKPADGSPQPAAAPPALRRARSKPEPAGAPPESIKPAAEPPNPSFLPGL
jgi:hypothetical protein